MRPPAFQFYPDDFLGGTMHFTDSEVGLYMRLLCVQWSAGSIPDDDAELSSYGKGATALARVKSKFQKCSDGRLRNERLEMERQKQADYRDACSNAGKVGAKKRWGGHSDPITTPIGSPIRNHSSPSPSPSPSTKEEVRTPELRVLQHLNTATGKNFRPIKSHLRFIQGRISDVKGDLDGIFRMIDRQVTLWRGSNMEEYLRPSTLFNATKFNEYYDLRNIPAQAGGVAKTPFNLTTIIKAKQEAADKIKFKNFTGDRWNDKASYENYTAIRKEIRVLEDQLAKLA